MKKLNLVRMLTGFILLLFMIVPQGAFSDTYEFTTFIYPGTGPGDSTWASGINDSGQIVGSYQSGSLLGFQTDGVNFSPINYPPVGTETLANGINNNGQIVGYYIDGGYAYGFQFDGVNFSPICYPSSLGGNGINDSGQIVGSYQSGYPEFRIRGFLTTAATCISSDTNSNLELIDFPGAKHTYPNGINNSGQIVGYYYYDDPNGVAYGFLKDGENYARIEYPGHPLTAYGRVTGINNNGQIVGYYYDPDTGEIISFLKDGVNYTKIIPPVGWRIYAKGINNSGQIVGWAHTPEGQRAFLATPAPPADLNTPPILQPIGDKTVSEGQTLEFTLSATDPEGNGLTYLASNLPSGATFVPATRTFSWTPTFDQAASYPMVLFTVTDNGTPPLSAQEAITITVGNVNRPPVLDSIGPKQTNEGVALEFVVNGSDPDNNNITFVAGNLPTGANLDPATRTFSWTPDYTQQGNFLVTFTVTDDGTPPLTVSETVSITVNNVNRPPVLNPIGNKTVNEEQLLQFTITATDPDGNALTFTANNLPAGAVFDQVTQIFSWTPSYNQAGPYSDIEFSVQDNGSPLEVDSELITITVGNTNRAPIFVSIGTQQVMETQLLQFNITANDPDGDGINYSCGSLPAGASFNPLTQQFTWTPTYFQAGNYSVNFYATDNYIPPSTGEMSVAIVVGGVPTPCELANQLINTVISLNLPKNVENSYMANIKKVCSFVESGKKTPAINQLNAFIQKVQQDISHGNISSVIGNNLINIANQLIAKIQG